MEIEIWKPVVGWEGLFEVSNLGRVKRCAGHIKCSANGLMRFSDERILNQRSNEKGYRTVELWKENKVKIRKVHRLVAQAFIANPLNLPQVNHIDTVKPNNRADNLEWCTGQYNMEHAKQMGILYHGSNKYKKLT